MNKKGDVSELFIRAAYLLLAFILLLMIWTHASSESRGDKFVQNYLARDLALLTETLYASPGNLDLKYELSETNYKISFREGIVEVYHPEEKIRAGFWYAEDNFLDRLDEEFEQEDITFSKNHNLNV